MLIQVFGNSVVCSYKITKIIFFIIKSTSGRKADLWCLIFSVITQWVRNPSFPINFRVVRVVFLKTLSFYLASGAF